MDLTPDFPVVEAEYQMTRDWAITVPAPMNRRFEEKQLVLWRPGLTAWIAVWGDGKFDSAQDRLKWIKETASKDAYDRQESSRQQVTYYSYRLAEPAEDRRVPALYCFAVGSTSHVQLAVYFDREQDLPKAESLCRGPHETHKP